MLGSSGFLFFGFVVFVVVFFCWAGAGCWVRVWVVFGPVVFGVLWSGCAGFFWVGGCAAAPASPHPQPPAAPPPAPAP
ncbi:hypothetical protein PUR61_19345, partial [Streptomyces sp. BE20]|nr:hypothetical protein [Streptomyces sp. BE20]